MSQLGETELTKYARQISLPDLGLKGQQKLKEARVLVIGAGGLGCPALYYLAAAGVGTIGIADFDQVDASNLQRQILYTEEDVGKPKIAVARNRLQKVNSHIQIRTYPEKLDAGNALDIINDFDWILDGTDNFPARYLINDACVLAGKPFVYASVYQFEGQMAVFNFPSQPQGESINYRDLCPEPPPPEMVPDCATGGILGVLPGIMGSMQALEVIKLITGIGDTMAGKLLLYDAVTFEHRIVKMKKNPSNRPLQKLIDYEVYCVQNQVTDFQEITVDEYQNMVDSNEKFQLIDVREPYEKQMADLGGQLIPLAQIIDYKDQISSQTKVVFYCKTGARSKRAIKLLKSTMQHNALFNLKGGILAYADHFDASLRY